MFAQLRGQPAKYNSSHIFLPYMQYSVSYTLLLAQMDICVLLDTTFQHFLMSTTT